MSAILPNWVNKMDRLYHAKEPFLGVIPFDRDEGKVYTMAECQQEHIYFQCNDQSNFDTDCTNINSLSSITFQSPDPHAYAAQFDQVLEEIKMGNTYLLNLCNASKSNDYIDLLTLFHCSDAPYRLYYKGEFVVFSPETFVFWEGDLIKSFPMKGTIDATIPNAASILLSDEKERAEHYTIVDLIRNDIGGVCDQVRVHKFGFLQELNTSKGPIFQMSSEIQGVVSSDFIQSPGRLFYSLLPAGSISGAPKTKTVEIIKAVESMDRGYYTGVMVYYNGYTFDSGVMIRFVEKDEQDNFWYKSGGGITHKSDMKKEYEELIRKIYLPIS